MANKKYREERLKADKERRYKIECNKLKIYPKFCIALSIAIILCFFLKWTYVYNTDIKGSEVSISGFNTLFAALSGNYSGAEKIFGNMAVPFYYYAADYCRALGMLTITTFFVSVINSVCQSFTLKNTAFNLNIVCLFLSIVQVGLFIACFTVALSMKNASILSVYCKKNPACSIKSLAIIPAFIATLSAAFSCIAVIKLINAKKILK